MNTTFSGGWGRLGSGERFRDGVPEGGWDSADSIPYPPLAEREGEHAEAVRRYGRSAQLRATGDALARLRGAELNAGDPAGARATLEEALTIEPGHTLALVHRGALAGREGDFVAAERDSRAALASESDRALAHYKLAVVLLRTGRAEEAERHLRHAIDADPGHVLALVALAEQCEVRGEIQEAQRLAARVVRLRPTDEGVARLARRLGVAR